VLQESLKQAVESRRQLVEAVEAAVVPLNPLEGLRYVQEISLALLDEDLDGLFRNQLGLAETFLKVRSFRRFAMNRRKSRTISSTCSRLSRSMGSCRTPEKSLQDLRVLACRGDQAQPSRQPLTRAESKINNCRIEPRAPSDSSSASITIYPTSSSCRSTWFSAARTPISNARAGSESQFGRPAPLSPQRTTGPGNPPKFGKHPSQISDKACRL